MPPVRARRRRPTGNEVVDNLNTMINGLITENRQLRRQLEKLSAGVTGATSQAVERGLRGIQRRLERALADGGSGGGRRRGAAASAGARQRSAAPRTRKPVSPEVAEKRRQALAKARAARAAKREAASTAG